MKNFCPHLFLASFALTACEPSGSFSAAGSCPSEPVSVMRVIYQEEQSDYLVFHTASSAQKQMDNPLHVKNLQMSQISNPKGNGSDFAKMSFKSDFGKCTPILEMTQGFKIELQQVPSGSSQAHAGGGAPSYWAPFLMGAVAGHLLSSGPATAPAYYLPPPSSQQAKDHNGVVTGGVHASSSDELNKKYESEYKQTTSGKKGFFSRSQPSSAPVDEPKRTGFFSSGNTHKRSSGGFFRKK